jgi:hypothetical protein
MRSRYYTWVEKDKNYILVYLIHAAVYWLAGFGFGWWLGVCFILAFILLWHYQAPTIMQHEHQASHRSLITIIKQKVFIIAMSSAAVGYIIMSYIMSMHVIDGFSLQQTKFVIHTFNCQIIRR